MHWGRPREHMDLREASEVGDARDHAVTSTPHKRTRRDKRSIFDPRDSVEFLPVGGSFSRDNAVLEDSQDSVNTISNRKEALHSVADHAQQTSGLDVMVDTQANGQTVDESIPTVSQTTSKDVGTTQSQMPTHPEMRLGP